MNAASERNNTDMQMCCQQGQLLLHVTRLHMFPEPLVPFPTDEGDILRILSINSVDVSMETLVCLCVRVYVRSVQKPLFLFVGESSAVKGALKASKQKSASKIVTRSLF